MLKLIVFIKDKNYDSIFEGNLDQFEDCFFSFNENSSIENKLQLVKDWVEFHNYSLEIKDGSKIYA